MGVRSLHGTIEMIPSDSVLQGIVTKRSNGMKTDEKVANENRAHGRVR
jgi:hypothetical protein